VRLLKNLKILINETGPRPFFKEYFQEFSPCYFQEKGLSLKNIFKNFLLVCSISTYRDCLTNPESSSYLLDESGMKKPR